jgi:predicted membrane protein
MTYEIKKIEVWSCVKIAFVLFGVIGLLFGIFYAMILTMVGGILSQMGSEFESLGGLFTGALGIFMVFFLAILYAVMGAVVTAILTWIYNLLAKGLGGIKLHLAAEELIAQASPQKSEPDSEGMLGKYKYE